MAQHCCCPPDSSVILNYDEAVIVQDFGPEGTAAPVCVKLTNGLKPGGIVNAVVSTDINMALNIKDAKDNILIHCVSRVSPDNFALNSFLAGSWGPEVPVKPVPTQQGVRFALTLVSEREGYRVFINGVEAAFYTHRSSEPPATAEVNGGVAYKLLYVALKEMSK